MFPQGMAQMTLLKADLAAWLVYAFAMNTLTRATLGVNPRSA